MPGVPAGVRRSEARTPSPASLPLVAVLRSDHRLAALEAIGPHDLVGETFISVAETAPTLRVEPANKG